MSNETEEDFSQRNHPEHADAYWGGWSDFIGAPWRPGLPCGWRTGGADVQDGPFADTNEKLAG